MADLVGFAATTFVAIFAIVNPVGAMTFFVVLTRSYPPAVKKRVIEKAVLAATVTLLIFAFVGNNIFLFFGTSIPAFRIAGGILLFSIGCSMMRGGRSRSNSSSYASREQSRSTSCPRFAVLINRPASASQGQVGRRTRQIG